MHDIKETVRAANPIVEVIQERVNLRQIGKRFVGLCPFHLDQDTPNFNVFPETESFYCFACGIGGDVFAYVMQGEKLSFSETLKSLAEKKSIPFSSNGFDREKEEKNRLIEAALREAALLYHKKLPQEVRRYLNVERGLTDETIEKYLLGFCEGNAEFQSDRQILIETGLLYENGREYFQGFITFPHFVGGKIVFISGRGWPEKVHRKLPIEKIPLNHLYNENALKKPRVIVAEGEIDTLTLLQNGFNACGVLGATSFKKEWSEKFQESEKVYLSFDGDKAGRDANRKIAAFLGRKARIVRLPNGEDVNDFFKHASATGYQLLVDESLGLIETKIKEIPPDTSPLALPEALAPILKELAEMDIAQGDALLRHFIKNHFGLSGKEIGSYEQELKRYRKIRFNASAEDKKFHSKPVYTAIFENLVDLVSYNDAPAFLLKEGSKLSIEPQIEKDGTLYHPPPKEQIPWLLPRGEEVLKLYEIQEMLSQKDRDGALYEDLLNYLKSISQLPGDDYYDLLAAWVMHTYLLKSVQYTPILCLFAVPERGKSRTGKGLIYVAYRGIHVESLRDPYLVRVASDLNASIFFDVKDIWDKAEKNGSEDILLHRFEKGAKVPRVLYPEKGAHKDIVYYSIFGPTIIGTNEGVHKILETRAVSINMPETSRKFENAVTPELGLPFKERLLAFRARYIGVELQDIPKPAPSRLGDILKPLLQIIRLVKPEREPHFMRLVRDIEAERLIEKAESVEAQILNIVSGLGFKVDRGVLPVQEITAAFNSGKPDKMQFTPQRIGRKLASMGFKKARLGDGASAIIWDKTSIDRMKERFGLEKMSETSETSETQNNLPEISDISELSDVSRDLFQENN